ncbi:TPA: cyclic GMP-AMP synthase DncV-like nucleotidyltransferase [Bacillus paranthracis]
MYNLSSKFNTFYNSHVVLQGEKQSELVKKKNTNIDRLKDGLKEYNDEHDTTYKVVDDAIQGSVAMHTVTQNDENEYDIDVAIIFDKSNIPDSTTRVKNIMVDALKRKCSGFRTEPEAKTNCIRIEYASGYHIDFAIYRRFLNDDGKYEYEHCGSEWRSRNPWAITNWFNTENTASNSNLRSVVRLLKMFCKSRDGWSMPGGLIQSVLASESVSSDERLDVTFYDTICNIRDRLGKNQEVYNPTNTDLTLLYTAKDKQKVKNLHSRLTSYINKLSVLFEDDCTKEKAIEAWNDFFNHSYWAEQLPKNEERIQKTIDMFAEMTSAIGTQKETVTVQVFTELVSGQRIPLNAFKGKLPKGKPVTFIAEPSFTDYTDIKWFVNNTGDESVNNRSYDTNGKESTHETKYRGKHTVTCKVYRNQQVVCQTVKRVSVR